MKKTKLSLILFATIFSCSTLVYSADTSVLEEEENVFKRTVGVSYEYRYYFMAGHSCHPVSTTFPELKKEQLAEAGHYFDSLISRGLFERAFNVPLVYKNCPKYGHSPTGGFPNRSDMPVATVDEVATNIISYMTRRCPEILNEFVSTSQYQKAIDFAQQYGTTFVNSDATHRDAIERLSTIWLDQVRDKSTIEVEGIVRVVQALTPFPSLQAQERAKALAIIDVFPAGDARRTHLQSRYDSILATPIPAVPSASALEFFRRAADAL